jgi:hypothetical protein
MSRCATRSRGDRREKGALNAVRNVSAEEVTAAPPIRLMEHNVEVLREALN